MFPHTSLAACAASAGQRRAVAVLCCAAPCRARGGTGQSPHKVPAPALDSVLACRHSAGTACLYPRHHCHRQGGAGPLRLPARGAWQPQVQAGRLAQQGSTVGAGICCSKRSSLFGHLAWRFSQPCMRSAPLAGSPAWLTCRLPCLAPPCLQGVAYRFRVVAKNSAGTGPSGALAAAFTTPITRQAASRRHSQHASALQHWCIRSAVTNC